MKKKIFTLIFAICLIIPAMFMLSACDGDNHTHTFETEWTTDADNHWHNASCEHSDIVSGFRSHTWNTGVVLSTPTKTNAGQTKYTCTVCGKEKIVDVAPVNAKNVDVHYDLNGGSWDKDDVAIPDYTVQYINSYNIILTEQVPVLANYVFGGWDLQVDLTNDEANVIAIWLGGMEGITDENGDPINPKRMMLDENGDPDFIPTKATTYIDVNENGKHDADEPVQEYVFTGWQTKQANGTITINPTFKPGRLIVPIKFDFNGGFPSDSLNGVNPYNLETMEQSSGEYYQYKNVVAYNNQNNLTTYRAIIMDDDMIKCYASANSADIWAQHGYDQVSIPVRTNYTFIGWATDRVGTNNIVIPSYFGTHQMTGYTIYVTNNINFRLPTLYAIYKESKVETMNTRVAFDFNEGYPSMFLGGTITTSLDTSAQTWETNTNPALNHYVQYKVVTGYATSNTTYEYLVEDDSTQNSLVDSISIPVRTGYTFTGWGLEHNSNPIILSNSGLFVYYTDTNLYEYNGASVGNSITLYAQWRENTNNRKVIIQYIEDDIDFNTGDETYHSIMTYTAQSNPPLSTNPNADGIFLEVMYDFGGTPIGAPTPSPVGGNYNGETYIFSHWTYDAVNNSGLDAFDANTTVDVPYVLNSSPAVAVLKFYAVYKPAGELFYHGRVDVSSTTVQQSVKIPITDADFGKYLIVVYCSDHDDGINPPNCGVRVNALDDSVNPPIVTQLVEAVPLDYLIYYSDTFIVTSGSALYLEYFLPHNANSGQWFVFDIYHII